MSRLRQVPVKDDRRLLKTPWMQLRLALAVLGLSLPSMLNAQTQPVSFGGTVPASLGSGFISPAGVAVDASGDVFVTDIAKNTVQEIVAVDGSIPAANPTILTLGGGFLEPYGVAVDAAGDVFVADTANSAVKEIVAVNGSIPATGATILTLGSGFDLPTGVAVDAFGDVFVADQGNNAVKEIVAVNGVIPAANPTILTLGSGFNQPFGVAVDTSGDVFLSDSSNNAVKEIVAVNGIIPAVNPTILSLGSGFLQPDGVAVDAFGDVFVADFGSDAVEEIVAVNGSIPAANPTILALGSGFTLPTGVAVGTNGAVFAADYGNHLLKELQLNSVDFGDVNICPLSQATPAPCSTALTLNYNVTTAGTLGAIVVTGGGDFALAAGSTCTGAVTAGVCTVNVTFTPLFAGLRGGGVEVTDANNQPLVSTLLSGIGVGPQIGFSPSGLTTIPDDDVVPFGIAVDDAGNVFVSDNSSLVLELPASGGAPLQVGTGLLEPYGLATDGLGDVFIADAGNDRVEEVTPLGIQTTVGSGLSGPEGVWVDRAGNVFIADTGNNRVVEVPANGGPQITLPTTGLAGPYGVGVDPLGNIYIADTDNAQVVELPVGGGPQITVGSGFSGPVAVAFDAAGDVLVADGLLYEIPVGGGLPIQLDLGFDVSTGVAVNGAGGIFNADETVLLLQRVQPPSLNFATTAVGTTSADSPQSVEIQNIGNAPLILSGLTVGTNFAQVAGSGTPPDCAVALSLAADALCNLSIDFTPTVAGTIQSAATLTDNSLNVIEATQSIPLTSNGGVTDIPVTMTVTGPLPLPLAPGQTATFTVSEVDANGNLVAGDDNLVTLSLTGAQASNYQLPLTNGQGTLQIILTAAGTYALAANDATDDLAATDNFTVGTGGTNTIPTTLTLTATPAGTNFFGQPVTLTATLAPFNANGVASDGETITFLGNGVTLGTGTLAGGVATLATSALPQGTDSLTATYPGDTVFQASASTALSYTVTAAPQEVSPAALNFGDQPYETLSAAQVVTVTNTGTTDLTFDGIAVNFGTNLSDFASTNNCPAVLTAGISCQISVTFTPGGVGVRTANLNIYFTDANGLTVGLSGTGTGGILQVNPGNLKPIAGDGNAGYAGDGGPAIQAELNTPIGGAFDSLGNLYFADNLNHAVRKVDLAGNITTVAGTGVSGYTGDGGPATVAQLNSPWSVAIDGAGNLYIQDNGNEVIRKVDPTGIITTFAGNGQYGYSGDGGPAIDAEFSDNLGLRFDAAGNLYIAQCVNSVVRKIDTAGVVTTVAGNGSYGYSGDGGLATSAELGCPAGVVVDAAGNLLIAEFGNSILRKVDVNGIISTIAGTGTGGFSGDGGVATSAQLFNPGDVDVDAAGNIYIADNENDRIRKIDTTGIITTVAGGLNNAGSAGIDSPEALMLDAAGNLYFSDSENNAVRELFPTGLPAFPPTPVGTAAASQTVTLSNIGNLPVTIASQASFVLSGNTVDFSLIGGSCLDGATLAGGGACTLQVGFTPTAAGTRTLNVTVTDDALDQPQSFEISGTGTASVLTPTTLTLTATPPGSSYQGQAVTLTAVLTTAAGTATTATGPVTFANDGGALPGGVVTLVNGVATFTTTQLPVSADSLSASYPGDAVFAPSASAPLGYSVLPQVATSTTLAITSAGQAVTTVAPGTAVALTATVTVATGAPVTPGTVLFCDATALLCENSAILGIAQLTTAGTATLNFVPGIGAHSYKAIFAGTTGFSTSISGAQPLTVSGTTYPTTTTITASGTPGNYTLTGTVVGTRGPYAQTSVFVIPNQPYTDTGIAVTAGQPLAISATGELDWYTGGCAGTSCTNGPNGSNPPNPCPGVSAIAPNLVCYSLIGKIGTDGTPFQVGASLNIASPATGELFLGVNDGYFADNTLGWTAFVNLSPAPTGSVNFVDTTNGNASLGTAAIGTATLGLSYTNSATPAAPGNPTSIVTADFNGDGKPDLAIGNLSGTTLTILLDNGDGTYTSVTGPTVGAGSYELTAGDFNSDGKIDLAVANTQQATVFILLGNGDGTFAPGNGIELQGSPGGIVTGDFNADGKLDLAVSLATLNTVSIFTGNGDGSFNLISNANTQQNPGAMAVGDWNGDGLADLAVTNAISNSITIYLSNGDGTLTTAGNVATGIDPQAIAAGDFDGDGKADLAVANHTDATVSILLGDGTGNFTAKSLPATGAQPFGIALADFNGDGILDLATANYLGATASVLLGVGDGTFSPASTVTVGNAPQAIVAGDWNGDGVPDFATANAGGNTASVLLVQRTQTATATLANVTVPGTGAHNVDASYSGDANFTPSVSPTTVLTGSLAATTLALTATPVSSISGQPVAMTATLASVVPVGTATGNVTFFAGETQLGTAAIADGTATFTTSALAVGADNLTASYAGDANFAQSTSPISVVNVSPVSTGPLATVTTLTAAPAGTAAAGTVVTLTASVTANGAAIFPGVVTFCDGTPPACANSALVSTAQLTPSGTAVLKLSPGIGSHSYYAVFAGTANDLASTSSAQLLTVTAAGLYSTMTTIAATGAPGNYTLTGTVTGFGSLTSAPTGLVSFLDTTNANAGLGTAPLGAATLGQTLVAGGGSPLAAGAAPYAVVAGDFNGDGFTDFAVENYDSDTVGVFLGNGDGTFQAQVTYAVGTLPEGIAAADLNGDGRLDLVVTNTADSTVSVLLGNGDGTFQTQVAYGAGYGSAGIVVVDLNHDGVPDIATSNFYGNSVSVLLGNGDGTFQEQTSYAAGNEPRTLTAGNFDQSGNVDLAVGNQGDGTVSILLGNGDGTFQAQVTYPTGTQPQGVAVADFNADDKADLAIGNSGDATVGILLGNGDGTFQAMKTSATGNTPLGVVVADFNKDGKPDIAVENNADGTEGVLLGNGDGTFQAQTVYPVGTNPYAAAAGDFNGDGFPDLVISNFGSNNETILLDQITSTATATLANVAVTGSGTHNVAASYAGDANFTASISSATVPLTGTTGGGSSGTGVALNTINPALAPVDSSDTTLTLGGFNFTAASVVNFGATPLATTFVNANQLTAVIPAALLTTVGTVSVTVTDASSESVSQPQTFTIAPATVAVTFSGPPTSNPGEQPSLNFTLQQPYPVALSGTMTLTFTPDPGNPANPQVQFATGGQTFNFTLPANTTTTPQVLVQAGTISGTITVSLTLTADGVNVTPPSLTPITIVVPKIAPTITALSFTTSGNVLTVVVTGYSSTREIQSAAFSFTPAKGATLSQTTFTLPATTLFTTWYTNTASTQYGSSFTYTQIFNLSGPATVVGGVGATLTNSIGTSAEVTAP